MATYHGRCILCAAQEWLSGDTGLCSHCGRVVRLGEKAAKAEDAAAATEPQHKPRLVYGADDRLCRLPVTGIPADCTRWVLHVPSHREYATFAISYGNRVEWWLAGCDGQSVCPLYLQRMRRTGRP